MISKLKRILYLGYYLKKLDFKKYKRFLLHTSSNEGISIFKLQADIIYSSLAYNISLLEYFQFHFYKLNRNERKKYAGTGYMYEYQLKMNPPNKRHILDNKNLFNKEYKPFLLHNTTSIEEIKTNPNALNKILSNPSGKLVLKVSDGKCGAEVEIRKCNDFSPQSLLKHMKEKGYDLVEEFIIQHPDIMKMSPSAVNTIRIFTQLDREENVKILGCRFRISVNSKVDNLAAGNLAAPIDELTGIVNGPGIYGDITKAPEAFHPETKTKITGFQIPFWKETIELVIKAAKAHPQNRSIGWDVVITSKGPGLIEGNHDWCKLVWQLPVRKGLKPMLEKFE